MLAYQCQRTGLLYPAETVESWGVNGIGVGLGPEPISEALVNCYNVPPVGDGEQLMHPLAVCRAPLARVDVTLQEYDDNKAILQRDDRSMSKRAKLMREKQLLKSPKLKQMVDAAKA